MLIYVNENLAELLFIRNESFAVNHDAVFVVVW